MPRQAPVRAPDDVFDADAVWTLFEGRIDRLSQVWQISQRSLPAALDRLDAAVAAEDWPDASRHAHSLAGSASNFGAHALVALARRIEDDAARGGTSMTDVSTLRGHLEALMTSMAAWLEKLGPPAGPAPAADRSRS